MSKKKKLFIKLSVDRQLFRRNYFIIITIINYYCNCCFREVW